MSKTTLFDKYYNNPTKSYIYANMACNGTSADEISFDITKEQGVISDNEKNLSSIDLAGIHVPVSQYTSDMKIIEPFSMIYVKGVDQGSSFTTKAYGLISKRALEVEDWMYRTTMILHIKYLNEFGNKVLKCIVASGILDDKTFIEEMQSIFDEAKIPINVTYEDRMVYFTATQEGYDFWISDIEVWHYLGDGKFEEDFPEFFTQNTEDNGTNNLGFGYDDGWIESSGVRPSGINDTMNAYTTPMGESQYREIYNLLGRNSITDTSTDVHNIYDVSTNVLFNTYMFEDLTKYVPAKKYRNGAMKGCVVVATYPQFNADGIQEEQRALKMFPI